MRTVIIAFLLVMAIRMRLAVVGSIETLILSSTKHAQETIPLMRVYIEKPKIIQIMNGNN